MSQQSSNLVDEVLEYNTASNYPLPVQKVAGELDSTPYNLDCFRDNHTVLWRGDTLSNYGSMLNQNDELSRDFPIYFTSSIDEAMNHGMRKSEEIALIEMEVPYDAIESLPYSKAEIETQPDNLNLDKNTVYLEGIDIGVHKGQHILAIAKSIPQDWIEITPLQ